MDTVRVLRVLEYVGPRDAIEEIVAQSIHGEKHIPLRQVMIRAATIGCYPEILKESVPPTGA